MAVVPSPGVKVAVAESLIRDHGRVSEWCDLWRMKLNASKTKTMIVSRSRTMHPQSPPLTIGGTVLKESDDLVILGVKHLRSVSRAASQRLGILRKSWRVFHDRSLLGRCFRGFVMPVLEYCSAVWCSAADTHLKLLDRAVSGTRFLTGGVFECDISHRRSVAVLCMLYVTRCTLLNQKFLVVETSIMVGNRWLWSIMLGNANEARKLRVGYHRLSKDFFILENTTSNNNGHHWHLQV